MTSPRRLLDEGTPFERDVLASAREDAGGAGGLKRTLAVMSLGAAAGTAVPSIGAASVAASTPAGAGAAAGPASAGTGALLKWIALALVVGTAAATPAIPWASRRSPVVAARVASPPMIPATLTQPSMSPPPATTDEPPQAAAPSLASAPSPASDALIRAVGVSAGSNRSVAAPGIAKGSAPSDNVSTSQGTGRDQPGESDPGGSAIGGSGAEARAGAPGSDARPRPASALYAELAALAGVRAALDKGDSSGALQSLAAYDSAFPGSVLAEEATVLRIEALAQEGDSAAAAALGRRFLEENPSSPHAPHVRRTVDAHNP